MSTKTNELLKIYINNMKFSLPDANSQIENLQDDQSYFKITINKINYFIENAWLKDHIHSVHQSYIVPQNNEILNITGEIHEKILTNNEINKDQINKSQENSDLEVNLKSEIASEKGQTLDSSASYISLNNNDPSQNNVVVDEQTFTDEHFLIDETQKIPTLSSLTESKLETSSIASITQSQSASIHETEEHLLTDYSTPQTTTTTPTTTPPTSTKPPTVPKESIIVYGKEAVLMRLSNRIKILELNMSLSSQYLEKLSRHYRIQMEEMETTFNFTTNALKEATRVSDERDQKQQMRIVELEKRLETLQQTTDSLVLYIENITFQTNVLSLAVVVLISLTVVVEVTKKLFSKKSRSKQQGYQQQTSTLLKKSDSQAAQLTQSQIEFIEKIIEKRVSSVLKAKRKSFSESIVSSNQSNETETLGLRKVQII